MDPTDVARAVDAAMSIAVAIGLPADDATVLHDSNKLALRLLPCDVFARVSAPGHEHATFEVDLARKFAAAGCPVAALDPRVEPRGYQRDVFEVTFWTFYEPASLDCVPMRGVEDRAFLEAVGQVRGAAGNDSSPGLSERSATDAAAM